MLACSSSSLTSLSCCTRSPHYVRPSRETTTRTIVERVDGGRNCELVPAAFDGPEDKAVEIFTGSANVSPVPEELEQPGHLNDDAFACGLASEKRGHRVEDRYAIYADPVRQSRVDCIAGARPGRDHATQTRPGRQHRKRGCRY